MAAISCDSNLRKPELAGVVEDERSIIGFGLASQAGLESETAAATIAKSSGEQATSLASPPVAVSRGRVCVNADVDNNTRAKLANKARGNSFLNSIDRELPSLNQFLFLILLCEEGTAQILWQCSRWIY